MHHFSVSACGRTPILEAKPKAKVASNELGVSESSKRDINTTRTSFPLPYLCY